MFLLFILKASLSISSNGPGLHGIYVTWNFINPFISLVNGCHLGVKFTQLNEIYSLRHSSFNATNDLGWISGNKVESGHILWSHMLAYNKVPRWTCCNVDKKLS
jgi:hypothetical protein